jgi:hypothetical protein
MGEYVPVFLHLFGLRPDALTYDDWLGCKSFADEWIKAQREGGV